MRQLVEMGSQRIETNTVLALDLSDIRKEYAKKMEHLATVRDGSTGELHQDYWLCDVTGAEVVRLPGREEKLLLVVVSGFGRQPLLLTNVSAARDSSTLWWMVEIYRTRWKIEETFRFMKQSCDLEDIRVLKYQRLKNLVVLVTAAAYFAAAFLGYKMKLRILCEKLLVISQRFFGIPLFRFYALADGIKTMLAQTSPNSSRELTAALQMELFVGYEA